MCTVTFEHESLNQNSNKQQVMKKITEISASLAHMSSPVQHNYLWKHAVKYEGRSGINASYFIMLAHDVRGKCC
jgi:hypothetical protein